GSPLEMVPLAHVLEAEGWTVSIARLAGHGTSPTELAQMTWKDWLRSAEEAYEALHDRCARVAVIGLSMGGALGLYLAGRVHPAAVVAISTPIRVRPMMAKASRVTARVLPYAPVVMRLGPREVAMRRYRSPYRRIPLRSLSEVDALLGAMRAELPRVRAPALILQGRRDWIIPKDSARELRRGLTRADAHVLWLPRSGHVATLDRDRGQLAGAVTEFLRAHLDRGAGGEAAGHGTAD
ncbi:MAG TPA: alpha/beta fold hydrolase, partial [bacterium]|nr:alpha/beta fold hydrolase [bacterium]